MEHLLKIKCVDSRVNVHNFSFNKSAIYTHDDASAKFSTNSHESDNSVQVKKCAAKEGQNSTVLYRHEKPKESTEEGPLSYVLQAFLFTSISTVSRVHTSLVSLVKRHRIYNFILSFKLLTWNAQT